ncbi:MAG: adenylate/guanylate cyclase domain-containing protein [Nitrososphaeraceae archaeon]
MYKNSYDLQLEHLPKLSRLINKINVMITESRYKRGDLTTIKKKLLTVVFWDIKNFSSLCDILKTHSTLLVLFLREFFEIASEIIYQHNGKLDKFLGDGVMALFGFQSTNHSYSHDAICAVHAAVELRERFKGLETKWVDIWKKYVPQKISMGLKCGINTGYATVDNIGTKTRSQFTAIGNTVNIASRLANISDSGQIVISSATKSRITNQFKVRRLGVVNDLKNISGSFEIFDVVKISGKSSFTVCGR